MCHTLSESYLIIQLMGLFCRIVIQIIIGMTVVQDHARSASFVYIFAQPYSPQREPSHEELDQTFKAGQEVPFSAVFRFSYTQLKTTIKMSCEVK